MEKNPDTDQESAAVKRHFSVFSNETDLLIRDYEFVNFDLIAFRECFDGNKGDPLLYYDHEVEQQQVEFLAKYLPAEVVFDFERYSYFVSCSAQTNEIT